MAKRDIDSFEGIIAKGMAEFGKVDETNHSSSGSDKGNADGGVDEVGDKPVDGIIDGTTDATVSVAKTVGVSEQKVKEISMPVNVIEKRSEFVMPARMKPIAEKKELAKVWPPQRADDESDGTEVMESVEANEVVAVEEVVQDGPTSDISTLTEKGDDMVSAAPSSSSDLLLLTPLPAGPPSIPPSGPPSNLLAGPPSGPPASLLSGPPAGPPSGPPSGPPASLLSGPPSGPPAGPPASLLSGPPSGPPAGPPASLLSGPPAGPPASLLSGPPAGPPSGPPAGPPASLPFTPKEKPKRDLFAALGSPKLVETPNLSESSALQSNVVNPPLELTTVVDENKNDFQIQEIDEPSLIEEVSANVETDEIPETRKVISADGGDDWFDAFEPEPEPEEAKRVVKYADSIEWY